MRARDAPERGFAILRAPADVGAAGPHAVDDAFVGCVLRVGECCDSGEVFEDAGVEGFPFLGALGEGDVDVGAGSRGGGVGLGDEGCSEVAVGGAEGNDFSGCEEGVYCDEGGKWGEDELVLAGAAFGVELLKFDAYVV